MAEIATAHVNIVGDTAQLRRIMETIAKHLTACSDELGQIERESEAGA